MPSLRASLALVAAAAIGVNSQVVYSIDPDSVDISTRSQWCTEQQASCPLLCLQTTNATDETTESNTCDPTTLDFSCVCDNGLTPDYNNFSQTIPFFECQQYVTQCSAACGNGNTACQSACVQDHPCGAQNPTRVNITSTTTSSTPTATGSSTSPPVFSGLGGSSTTSSTKKNGSRAALEVGRSYGLAIVFTGLFVGFAFVM